MFRVKKMLKGVFALQVEKKSISNLLEAQNQM